MPHITDLKLVPLAFHIKGARSPFPSVSSASEVEVCAVTVGGGANIRNTVVITIFLR
jgi:hypothetical protein